MKKVFMFLMAAAAVMSMAVSCEKDGKNKKNTDGDGNEEYTELISVDGKFDDWKDLKNVVVLERPEEAYYPGLMLAKVTADEKNFYLYLEYQLQEGQEKAPMSFFLNADGDETTGGHTFVFTGVENSYCGYEYNVECEAGFYADGAIIDMGAAKLDDGSPDGTVYEFTGEDGQDAWADGGPYLSGIASGVMSSAGTVKDGLCLVEISINREDMEIKASSVKFGIVVFTVPPEDWDEAGALPQEPSSTSLVPAVMATLDL